MDINHAWTEDYSLPRLISVDDDATLTAKTYTIDRAKALYKKITGNDYQLLSARMSEPGAMDIDYRPTEVMPEDYYAF